MGKLSTEEFIEKAKKKHGDKYIYSNVVYVNNKTPIDIICQKHGVFSMRPNSHLQGQGCPKCGNEKKGLSKKLSTKQFIEKAKTFFPNYDYSKVEYVGNKIKVIVICPEHGEFKIRPNDLLSGHGCPVCRYIKAHDKTRKTLEQFIIDAQKIHGNKYDYSKVNYVQAHEKITIICKEHGEFEQEPNVHLKGFGCPKCSQSHLERELSDALNKNNIVYEYEKDFVWLKNILPLTLDFFIPILNIGIECQGKQHFSPVKWFGGEEGLKKCLYRDNLKNCACKKNGITLLYYVNKNDFLKNDLYDSKNTFFNCDELISFLLNKIN